MPTPVLGPREPRGRLAYLDLTWPPDRVLREAAAAVDRRWVALCCGGLDYVIGAVSPREVVASGATREALRSLALPVEFAPDHAGDGWAPGFAWVEGPLVVFVDEHGNTTGAAIRHP